jgi:hypothetical protein
MKDLFILLLIGTSSFYYSCNSNTSGNQESKNVIQNDLKKNNLKGDVIFVDYTYQYDKYDPIITISEYNNGFLQREYSNLNEELKIYYYNKERLEKITTDGFKENKIYRGVEILEYDENMNLINKTEVKDNETYEYTYSYSNNRLYKESFLSGKIKSKSTYYYSENLDSVYTESENLLQINSKEYYNSKGQKIKTFIKFFDGSETLITKEYNEKGDEIKSTSLSQGGKTSTDNTVYVYDSNGNWVSKITKYNDGRISKSNRNILYKGDDFSKVSTKLNQIVSTISARADQSNKVNSSDDNSYSSSPSQNSFSGSKDQYSISNNQSPRHKCYECNGTGKCLKCSKPQRVRYKKGEKPEDHYETRIGMVVCTQCGGNTMNWGHDENVFCYLCKGTGWLTCRECNLGSGDHLGECKKCRGSGYY